MLGAWFFAMTDKIVILSTCATEEEAERLARALLDARLAACVNVVPARAQLLPLEGRRSKTPRSACW